MPKRTITEREKGLRDETPNVIVIYKGNEPLIWESQNFAGDGDSVEFTLLPDVKEEFSYEYARRVFGDWTIPKRTKKEQKEWADMIKDRVDRSPTANGCLPMVEIYDQDENLLWNAVKEFTQWIEQHGASMLPRPDKKSGVSVKMPKVLAEADGDGLKKLWELKFKVKMPAGMQYNIAREILLNMLGADQIADALKPEFEREPDMSRFNK